MAQLDTHVRFIKGIGDARAKALAKLGIETLQDLISWFPRRYEDRTQLRRIMELVPEESACVEAMIAAPPTVSHVRRGMDLVKVRAVDETGVLDVTFFNQTWLKNQLHQGESYVFYGKAEGNLLRRRMTSPIVEPVGRREFTGRIVPIYPLTAGVSQLILSRSIRQGLDACADILPDVLPDEDQNETKEKRAFFGGIMRYVRDVKIMLDAYAESKTGHIDAKNNIILDRTLESYIEEYKMSL